MNKYTLKFTNDQIEQQYQEEKIKTITKPCFYGFTFSFVIILIIRIVSNLLEEQQFRMLINSACVSSLLLIILFTYKKEKYDASMIIVNMGIALFQLTIENEQFSQNSYVFGSNMMMGHIMLSLNSSVIVGIICNIFIGASKIVIAILLSPNHDYQVYFLTIIVHSLYCYILYILAYYQRQSFYSSLKDNQWEQILTHISTDTYMMFNYDDNKVKFELKSAKLLEDLNLESSNYENFKKFIRNASIQNHNQSLELMIFQRIRNKETIKKNLEITVTFEKHEYKLIYSEFYLPKLTFLLQFHKDQPQEYFNRYKEQEKVQENCILRLLKYIAKISALKQSPIIKQHQLQQTALCLYWKIKFLQKSKYCKLIYPFKLIQQRINLFNKASYGRRFNQRPNASNSSTLSFQQQKIIIEDKIFRKNKIMVNIANLQTFITEFLNLIQIVNIRTINKYGNTIISIDSQQMGLLSIKIRNVKVTQVLYQFEKSQFFQYLISDGYLMITESSEFFIKIQYLII